MTVIESSDEGIVPAKSKTTKKANETKENTHKPNI